MTTKNRHNILKAIEIILLIPAFGFLIPPVPSEAGHAYNFFPGILFAAIFFGLSQCVLIARDKRAWWTTIVKLALFVVFGWIIFERVMT
jgi:hypothetical protein